LNEGGLPVAFTNYDENVALCVPARFALFRGGLPSADVFPPVARGAAEKEAICGQLAGSAENPVFSMPQSSPE